MPRALVVANTLIPALSHFIDGLKNAAGFFQIMEKELQSFEGKAGKNVESPKKLHYKVMRKEAKEMKSLCQAFYAVLPDVPTDFEAIPNEGTDQNYVDKWLERELAQIEEKRSNVQRFLLAIFKRSKAEGGEKADGDENSKDGEKTEDEKNMKTKKTLKLKAEKKLKATKNLKREKKLKTKGRKRKLKQTI